MKKHLSLLFIFIFIFTVSFALNACTSKAEAPVMKAAKAAPAQSSAVQRLYRNEKLGFTFAIPDSWESENYTPEVTNEVLVENGKSTQYTKVSFAFQADRENPLLTILIVPKTWWDAQIKKSDSQNPGYLGSKGSTVYCFTLPQDSTLDVGAKADLYNSMLVVRDDVPNRFQILNGDSSVEGVLEKGTTQSVLIKTDDGRELQFTKTSSQKVATENKLILGERLKIYYKGTVTGTDTSKATVTKLEITKVD